MTSDGRTPDDHQGEAQVEAQNETQTAPETPATPGLRGAPVRTPVKAGDGGRDLALWPAMAGRLLTRQVWIELYGLPGYGLTLKGPRAEGLSATPRDFRPQDVEAGKVLLSGRFVLAGASLEAVAPDSPWSRPSPSRAFAAALHAFSWLPDLMSQGETGAREALRLTFEWDRVFHAWSPFAWEPDILGRRVFNLAVAARRMGQNAEESERLRLAALLARQGRQLLRPPGDTAGRAERLIAAAVAGCALAGKAGETLRGRALSRLPGALKRTVLDDGAHASRSPEAALELLLDLLTLEDALAQISQPTPEAVTRTIESLTLAFRVLTLPDGRLAAFQGGGPSTPERVAAARAHDEEARAHPAAASPVTLGGLTFIASPLLTVAADTAEPAQGAWGSAACAQPAAIEVVCGKDRLFTSSGWTPRSPERQALRLTPGASTVTLGERSLGEPLSGWRAELLGPRLSGSDYRVSCEQREGDGAVWLEIEHDGWNAPYGLTHKRRLYLDQKLDELRAEEHLYPTEGRREEARMIAVPYAARFHLEPGVSASLARDRRSILLRGPSGRGWWFRTDGPDVGMEPSVYIDQGLTRRGSQIVVRGSARTDAETRIRWKLGPAGATDS